jgi:hypothetical protein
MTAQAPIATTPPGGRVRNIHEVYEWEQTRTQRLTVDVELASLGGVTVPGMPGSAGDGG